MMKGLMGPDLWAWVTEEPDGKISLIAMLGEGPMGVPMHLPLIGRSEDAIKQMEWIARSHAEDTGQKVWLRRYEFKEDIGRE